MYINDLPAEFKAALPILETLENAGYEAYFVGGSVRDTLLEKPIHDVDIATSAYPEEVKTLFNSTVDTGIEHGTVMILDHGQGYETTTFRTESTYTDFRRPDEVTFVRSLAEDLKRRDFTVNALALKPNGEVVDLFDGVRDLQNKILRAVGQAEERFHEDALRMMRAVRFAAQLDFKIEEHTRAAIKDNAALLEHIAIERINVEFTKLLQGANARYGLLEMMATKLNNYMPGLENVDIDLLGFAELLGQAQPEDDTQAWTLLAFELGLTPSDTVIFMKKWKQSAALIGTAKKSIALLNELRKGPVSAWQLYTTGQALENALAVADLSELEVDTQALATQFTALPIHDKRDLALTGADLTQELGLQSGPIFGKILHQVEQQVVAGERTNQASELLAVARTLAEKEKK